MRTYIYGGMTILILVVFTVSLFILDSDPLSKVGLGMLFCSLISYGIIIIVTIFDLIVQGVRYIWKRIKK
jgi:hypothetical protein